MERIACTASIIVILAAVLSLSFPPQNGLCGDPPWRTEFDETCANTSDSMALSVPELQLLITKCEKLQKAIEQLDESTYKVFLNRILKCKKLYQFILDTKKSTSGQKEQ
ncbi:MAG: hypothetical protein PHI31_06045 [Desulfuromonadaceae bacterium]|nr:hypothetical protein [Desulfuromonadaceae bacterium]